MAVPAVIRYGYGFVQGADAAAKEIGATDVNIKYWYSGGFAATDEVKNKMDGWYSRVPRSSLPAAVPSARAATLLRRPTAAR